MICPHCGAHTVRHYDGILLTTDPPQMRYRWWCLCGYLGPSETYQLPAQAQDDGVLAEWRKLNPERI